MNRTLLVEEGDDEVNNRQDKKKKEKEKLADVTDKKKRATFKKADGKREGHHNTSLTSSSKIMPADDMADMAAVNPNAEAMSSPVGTPVVPSPFAAPVSGGYQGNMVIIPPQRPVTLQQLPTQNVTQREAGNWGPQQQYPITGFVVPLQQPQAQLHCQAPVAHFIPANFQGTSQPLQQIQGQFVPPKYHQAPQYPTGSGMPLQGGFYSGQAVPGNAHGMTAAQSLPTSTSLAVEQTHSSGQASWAATATPASPPPFGSGDSSWTNRPMSEPREERAWKDDNKPISNSGGANDRQWAEFSPTESSTEISSSLKGELYEEHSSSDEDVDRSSSPELAGEEGEVLLRAPSLASFAESISSIEEESEENLWRILPEQRDYYTKQFQKLQPVQDGLVKGPKARDFFMKSGLPVEVLSRIWHLSDINKDNALNLDEFCIAMHLVVALRHGFELPETLPTILMPHWKETAVKALQGKVEGNGEHETRSVSSPDHGSVQPVHQRDEAKLDEVGDVDNDDDDDDDNDNSTERQRSLSDPLSVEDSSDGKYRRASVPASPLRPLNFALPSSSSQQIETGPLSPSQAVTAEIEIARPRATVKPSLLDALPGQLLPPPSGKQTRDGWTPTSKTTFIYQASPHHTDGLSSDALSTPPSSPDEDTPTSPLSPDNRKTPSPPPPEAPKADEEEPPKEDPEKVVVVRPSRKSAERPRSTGDVNSSLQSEANSPRSPGGDGSQSSASSDGRKEPPPPPPRNKKGHSRSSSLDLNKLFATKSKENRGTPPSSSSSHSSQIGESIIPAKVEPCSPENEDDNSNSSDAVDTESVKLQKQENFADFSRFESFVEAQETVVDDEEKKDMPQPKPLHRRSLSLDDAQDVAWSKPQQKNPSEAASTLSRTPHNQEALPRPVPKLKPPSPPTLKQGRLRTDKDGEKERKLKTEPPKVVVRPLTKEDKLNSRIQDLKEKNAALSKVNYELQEELKSIMERRATLELQLEKKKLPSS
ncbi:ralBP1-associated Eps domain-containing protein 1-like isoform X2 [Acropora millepora]|uniref:ralBP1-associated Eps domain-containing protein 1-like isoform X2 n=1 Tax=Acropora millepora TaxID=45264 RepID=UPI001CF0E726|nr:ralBP1-associated Eps domain-containing protein 1-like isoform X2 [Acropora millepora]